MKLPVVKNYIVVSDNTAAQLSIKVREILNASPEKNWQPLGGVSITTSYSNNTGRTYWEFAQAFVSYE